MLATCVSKKVWSAAVAQSLLELFPPPGAAGRERTCFWLPQNVLPEQNGERQGFLAQGLSQPALPSVEETPLRELCQA